MGAEPWQYFVPYEADLSAALHKLRQREFEAGRYFPVKDGLLEEFGLDRPPASIEEAVELAEETGTQSILDMQGISDTPDYGVVSPLSSAVLIRLFGTDKPTREMVEANQDFFEDIERGHGIYIVVYKDGQPSEICFAGYSFD